MNIDNLRKELQQTTDKLGKKIDEKIFETVLYLNASGINTIGSCEGHLDHGHAFPWIDIQSKEVLEKEEELKEKFLALQQLLKQNNMDYTSDEYKTLKMDYENLNNKLQKSSLEVFSRLLEYLEDFYKNRSLKVDTHLIVTGSELFFRIQPQGGFLQAIRTTDDKEKYLKIYQNEIREFNDFLESKMQIYEL